MHRRMRQAAVLEITLNLVRSSPQLTEEHIRHPARMSAGEE